MAVGYGSEGSLRPEQGPRRPEDSLAPVFPYVSKASNKFGKHAGSEGAPRILLRPSGLLRSVSSESWLNSFPLVRMRRQLPSTGQ